MKALGVNNNYLKGLNVSSMLIIKKQLSLEMLVGVVLKKQISLLCTLFTYFTYFIFF